MSIFRRHHTITIVNHDGTKQKIHPGSTITFVAPVTIHPTTHSTEFEAQGECRMHASWDGQTIRMRA
jgi:hypothetical protein